MGLQAISLTPWGADQGGNREQLAPVTGAVAGGADELGPGGGVTG